MKTQARSITYAQFRAEWQKRKKVWPVDRLAKQLDGTSHFDNESRIDTAKHLVCFGIGYNSIDPRDLVPWKPFVELYSEWVEGPAIVAMAVGKDRACACGCGARLSYGRPREKYLNKQHQKAAKRNAETRMAQGLNSSEKTELIPRAIPKGCGCQNGHVM